VISDAQFAAWLLGDQARRTWLVEIDYVYKQFTGDFFEAFTATLYLATQAYITSATDTPASTPYVDAVLEVPEFLRSIDATRLGQRGTASYGALTLDNADGLLNFLLDLALDGSQVRVYLGDVGWPRADFRHMFTALARKVEGPSTTRLTLTLADGTAAINGSVNAAKIGGSGPNAERMKAINLGYCFNVECVVVDTADLVYSYGSAAGLVAPDSGVRDCGLELADAGSIAGGNAQFTFDAATDTITTVAAHPFINEDLVQYFTDAGSNGLTNGARYFVRNKTAHSYQLSVTRTGALADITSGVLTGSRAFTRYNFRDEGDGTLTLAHPPAGQVTANVLTYATGTSTKASDIIEAIVGTYGRLAPGDIAGPHASFPVGTAGDFDLGVRIEARAGVPDTLDRVMGSALGFWAFDRTNKFTYGRIWPGALAASAVMDFTADDVREFNGLALTRADPLYYRWNWYHTKNWTVQTSGLDAAVTASEVARYAAKGTYGSAQDTTARPPTTGFGSGDLEAVNWHKTMTESPETETLLSILSPTAASNQSTLWYQTAYSMFLPWLEFVTLSVGLEAYALELGDVVSLTLPRWGFDSGPKFQVLATALRPTRNELGLVLVRNRTADISSSSYHA
jgi:hypothetical protein